MKPVAPPSGKPRRGQVLIFMLMMMIILTFVAFSVYDTQHVIVQRVRSQNASDSAALVGARWQLTCLNAIGELNLMKVTTDIVTAGPPQFGNTEGNYAEYRPLYSALDKLQAKIAITGPMMGVLYGEQAAKLNGMHGIQDYANDFYAYADFVERYANNPNVLNDPWLWTPVFNPNNPSDMQERQQLLMDFALLCREVADQHMAALPNIFGNSDDIASVLDWTQASPFALEYLGNRQFYAAIAGQDWCYLKPLLWIYSDWAFWGPVYINASGSGWSPLRILDLHLRPRADAYMGHLVGSVDPSTLVAQIGSQLSRPEYSQLQVNPNWPGDPNWGVWGFRYTNDFPRFDDSTAPAYVPLNWAVYRRAWSTHWDSTVVGTLLAGTVKQKCDYSYQNADSVWISQAAASVTMAVPNYRYSNLGWLPNYLPSVGGNNPRQESHDAMANLWNLRAADSSAGNGIVASAAAKAFGYIDDTTPPTQCPVVLPVFKDVRLIPLAVSSGGGAFDPGWMEHVVMHIPPYTQRGVYAANCQFCNELRTWDNPAFRQIGQAWWAAQANNPNPCPPPGGGGYGGGPNH